jgi:hypothetical protein
MSDIRFVAAPPWESDLFVAGEFRRRAHVWSLQRGTEVAAFDTALDAGGRRLALVTGGEPVVVAGAWERHGVCGYTLTGEQIWQSKTRSAVQEVTALGSSRVAVGYARGPGAVFDASTGRELRSLRGVSGVRAMTPGMSLLESSTYVRLADADLEPISARIALRGYGLAVLGAAAGPEQVAVAEAGGPLRILDFDGAERAAYEVPGGLVVSIAHDGTAGTWRALARFERADVVHYALLRLSDDAELLDERAFDVAYAGTWLAGGTALVYANDRGLFVLNESDAPARKLEDA